MEIRSIDANALKRYFSDRQMEYVSMDEADYTFNALMFDVLGDVITAIENAPTIEVRHLARSTHPIPPAQVRPAPARPI